MTGTSGQQVQEYDDDIEIIKLDDAIANDPNSMADIKYALDQSIFRPVNVNEPWHKRKIRQFCVDYLNKESAPHKRFNVIHRIVKIGIVHQMLNFVRLKLGKYLVQDINDIPEQWWNNHLRIFYHSFEYGADDLWKKVYYVQGYQKFVKQGFDTPEKFVKHFKDKKGLFGYNASYYHRQLLIQIWMTEILEDSMDREWLNMSIMRITHEMMKHYGVSEDERNKVPKPGEFPIYYSTTANYPEYFMRYRKMPVWKADESYYNHMEENKDVKVQETNSGGTSNPDGTGSAGSDNRKTEGSAKPPKRVPRNRAKKDSKRD